MPYQAEQITSFNVSLLNFTTANQTIGGKNVTVTIPFATVTVVPYLDNGFYRLVLNTS